MDLTPLPDLHRRPLTVKPTAPRTRRRAPQGAALALPRTALAQWLAGVLCGLPLVALAQSTVTPADVPPAAPLPALRSSPLLQEKYRLPCEHKCRFL